MKNKVILLFFLSVGLMVLSSCGKDDISDSELMTEIEEVNIPGIGKVPAHPTGEGELPDWLRAMMDDYEQNREGINYIIRAEYKGAYIYNVYNAYFSCLLCECYTSDGEHINWSSPQWKGKSMECENWTCIYWFTVPRKNI